MDGKSFYLRKKKMQVKLFCGIYTVIVSKIQI